MKLNNYRILDLVENRIETEAYKENVGKIEDANLILLTKSTITGTVLIMLIIAGAYILAAPWLYKLVYICAGLFCLLIAVLSCTALRKAKNMALPLLYIFIGGILALSIILGVAFAKDMNAALFLGMIALLPSIVIDKPWRITLFSASAVIIFCAASIYIKEPVCSMIDCTNALSMMILGNVLMRHNIKVKMTGIISMERLRAMSQTDLLTGLYNKYTTEQLISGVIEQDPTGCHALMLADMDDLKHINDNHSHLCGDTALRAVADALKSCFRHTDIIGRVGGDEFMIFLRDCCDAEQVAKLAEILLAKIAAFSADDKTLVPITVSIGITIMNSGEKDFAACMGNISGMEIFKRLYREADAALYEIKRGSKCGYSIYKRDANGGIKNGDKTIYVR